MAVIKHPGGTHWLWDQAIGLRLATHHHHHRHCSHQITRSNSLAVRLSAQLHVSPPLTLESIKRSSEKTYTLMDQTIYPSF
jgi:hypothetical protein